MGRSRGLHEASEAVHISRCPPAAGPGWRSGWGGKGSRRGAVKGTGGPERPTDGPSSNCSCRGRVQGSRVPCRSRHRLRPRSSAVRCSRRRVRARSRTRCRPEPLARSLRPWPDGCRLQYGALVDRPIVVADKRGSADRNHGRSGPQVSKETNHAGASYEPDMVVRNRKFECSLLTLMARAEFTYPYGYCSCRF